MKTRKRSIANRYELREAIGRGGMATIYRAHDRRSGREVALKLMRPDLAEDPAFTARFVSEAERAASIAHRNVLKIYDHGHDVDPYIAMELVAGPDLATLLARDGRLSPERAVEIAMQVAAALAAAHRHGIVHRDVKPSNLLLTDDERVKVVDFGIARGHDETSVTATGSTLGSVDYFSPEQARGDPATEASDVYALGIVLYEMLTGRRPFTGDSAYAIAVKRISEDPPDPRSVVPDLPPTLVAVVMRALRREPAQRYRSADGFRRALARWRNAELERVAAAAAAATAAAVSREPQPAPFESSSAAPTSVVPLLRPVAAAAAARSDPAAAPARQRRRLAPVLGLAAAALLLAVGAGLLGVRLLAAPDGLEPQVAEVGGEVREAPPLSGASQRTPLPTERPEATRPAATPEPTVEPTPVPTAAPTPQPPAPTPAPVAVVPEPGQPVAAAATADPAQAVATWYDLVAAGRFDEAHALWSPRMQASFDRQGNLDGRWDNTASVTINSVYVASQSGGSAAVQVDFTEAYDAGSARRFIGWWELVLVDGRWLLDWPHF